MRMGGGLLNTKLMQLTAKCIRAGLDHNRKSEEQCEVGPRWYHFVAIVDECLPNW